MPEQKIILTRGIPGSGKTTYARKWVAEDPDWRIRINRDDLRFQIAAKYHGLSRHQEETVTLLQKAQARAAIDAKLSAIVDDTNLRASTVREWQELAAELDVPLEIVDIAVDVEEAIERDKLRDRQVGEEVIRSFQSRFIQKGRFPAIPVPKEPQEATGRAYVPNPDLPKAVWVDIDGTLADMTACGRGPFEWHRVGEDDPIDTVIDVVKALRKDGYKIVLMSGRDEAAREPTVLWLKQHGVEFDDFFMRPAGDQRKDNVIKAELFWEYVAPRYDIRFALDDRDQVVKYTREVLKIPVFQVRPGNF